MNSGRKDYAKSHHMLFAFISLTVKDGGRPNMSSWRFIGAQERPVLNQ
jgi:hypothetical protein